MFLGDKFSVYLHIEMLVRGIIHDFGDFLVGYQVPCLMEVDHVVEPCYLAHLVIIPVVSLFVCVIHVFPDHPLLVSVKHEIVSTEGIEGWFSTKLGLDRENWV
jgi:hypothetical protein